jgi:hypothetical protein
MPSGPATADEGSKVAFRSVRAYGRRGRVHFASESISWLVLRRTRVAALGITINLQEAASAATVVLAATCGEWFSIETRTEL